MDIGTAKGRKLREKEQVYGHNLRSKGGLFFDS